MMKRLITLLTLIMSSAACIPLFSQGKYQNFRVAVYSRAYETQQMGDTVWLQKIWQEIEKQVGVDKIYLETHRDLIIVDEETIKKARDFFQKRGIQTAGGITYTVSERNRYETFCYSNPGHRQKVKEIAEYTARHFDEIILDDFFFTNCKCELCIKARGDMSWTDFRLSLMDKAARELVLEPARAVNPDVKVIIKYPNWYEHFQGLGFNLETGPVIFDGLYTGTETRDPSGNQHLQAYLGYLIFRYFENLKPGGNRGGWVDTGGARYLDRYAEQLWITLFAKAPEITLFDFRQLQRPLEDNIRAPWQGQQTSFDFDQMKKAFTAADGSEVTPSTIARAAGYTLETTDRFLGKLGTPVGIKSYKPTHSSGEDFLQTYLGMAGIPMDIVPEFPYEDSIVLLTQSAAFDKQIIEKIKKQLADGKDVVITSGLLCELQNKGIGDIAELKYTGRKALVNEFVAGWGPSYKTGKSILIPQISYLTNDSWEEVSARDETNGWPILHSARYAHGTLYVLTIPDNFTDLYHYPVQALTRIKEILTRHLDVLIEAPAQVSLFLYDNHTFIVESFLDETVPVTIVADQKTDKLTDLVSGEILGGTTRAPLSYRGVTLREGKTIFTINIKPHSYRVFKPED